MNYGIHCEITTIQIKFSVKIGHEVALYVPFDGQALLIFHNIPARFSLSCVRFVGYNFCSVLLKYKLINRENKKNNEYF